jgi:soluble lytic murein transglycosylase-like protein
MLLTAQLLAHTAGGQPTTDTAPADGSAVLSAAAQTKLHQGQERIHTILAYASKYRIPAPLAAKIYDQAVAERIPPDIGFRLVRVESDFSPAARSKAPAIGLTQLMVETASHYKAGVTEADLYDPDLNLQIGFRYLHDLIGEFGGSVSTALEAYNRGPVPIQLARASGGSVEGVYSRAVLRQ